MSSATTAVGVGVSTLRVAPFSIQVTFEVCPEAARRAAGLPCSTMRPFRRMATSSARTSASSR